MVTKQLVFPTQNPDVCAGVVLDATQFLHSVTAKQLRSQKGKS
ncbi:MAG: hypothetical protein SAK42_00355 [Oscillatoria sp. PMC 1076.18]|nr:hypothetical protein [Oscillatoria sp. PMC 1076.18]